MTHRIRKGLLMAVALCAASVAHAELTDGMEELSLDEMGVIVGAEGISFEWDQRYNANADGTIDTTMCPASDRTQCRLALQYANRSGEWTVFKGYHGRLYWSRIDIDAFVAPASATSVGDASRFAVQPYGRPHLQLTFPEPLQIYRFSIEGMAVEYGATGYNNDPTDANSFLGLVVHNSIASQPGTINYEGRVTLFGF